MAVRNTITASITSELKAFISGRVVTGRYANASEVSPAALRLMERHEPDLKVPRRKWAPEPTTGDQGERT